MKFNSQVYSAASGSVGGCTYSRNRSGAYVRRRAMPVNPGSAFAQVMTAFFSTLVVRWTTILTPTQRDAWEVWSVNTPHFDALGNSVLWTGQNAYISMNSFRLQNGKGFTDNAPIVYANAILTPTVQDPAGADASAQNVEVAFSVADPWANQDEGILAVYTSRPQNASVNYFKGPYRLAGTIIGDLVTPPTSPATIPVAFPIAEDQKLFVQLRCSQADARFSPLQRHDFIVVA